jgi:hypothetical protein
LRLEIRFPREFVSSLITSRWRLAGQAVASRNRFLVADFGGALAPMGMESFAYIVNESWQA